MPDPTAVMDSPVVSEDGITVLSGDCIEVMAGLADCSVHSVVCDPPYAIGFMGKEWDKPGQAVRSSITSAEKAENPYGRARAEMSDYSGNQESGINFQHWCQEWATQALRVLKPGGHLLAFGGTRTYHRLVCGIEDAGFEIRDSVHWLYGSGFPKSLNVGKAIDKAAGAEREVVGYDATLTAPATPEAEQWDGWGTALGPAHEPIVVARKPLIGTVAANVLKHGTGAINVDDCRIGSTKDVPASLSQHVGREDGVYEGNRDGSWGNEVGGPGSGHDPATGRWPKNVILSHHEDCVEVGTKVVKNPTGRRTDTSKDASVEGTTFGTDNHRSRDYTEDESIPAYECVEGCPVAEIDRQSGERKSGGVVKGDEPSQTGQNGIYGTWGRVANQPFDDTGGASRFFYHAKSSKEDRNYGLPAGRRSSHPTVKPIDLMRYLCRLVTPPDGTVLDPFMGSGTCGIAAIQEGFGYIGIEREAEYVDLAVTRIQFARKYLAEPQSMF